MMYEKHETQGFALRELVGSFGVTMKCADPQDRIYGVLGLAVDAEDFDALESSLYVSAPYIRTVAALVDQHKDLTVLHHANSRPLLAANEGEEEALPWCPTGLLMVTQKH